MCNKVSPSTAELLTKFTHADSSSAARVDEPAMAKGIKIALKKNIMKPIAHALQEPPTNASSGIEPRGARGKAA